MSDIRLRVMHEVRTKVYRETIQVVENNTWSRVWREGRGLSTGPVAFVRPHLFHALEFSIKELENE